MSLDRLREWMEVAGVRAAYLTEPISIGYLTGFRSDPHERLMALVVRPADATLIVPGLDEEAARVARGVEVRAWRDGQDPWAVVSDALATFGSGGRVAVDKDHLSLTAWERLWVVTDGAEPVDAGRQVRLLRARKAPWELELLGRAAEVTDQVTERVLAGLAVGSSELEVAMTIDLHIAEAGAQRAFEALVQSGPNSALPHGRPGDRRLGPGDLVLLDFGAAWQGYRGDTTRMAVVGAPDARHLEVHSVVLAAHDAAVATVRAGATAGEVDEAARAVIRAAGLGDRFIHRVGHGLGLEAHEDPSLDPGSDVVLEEGMVVTVEPGVYVPGWGGVRIEDDVVVEAGGGRLLTAANRELRVVD